MRLVPGSRVAPAGVGSAWVPRGGWVVPHWSLGADPEHGRGADPRLHAGHGLGSDHRVESEYGLDWHPRRDADRRLGADHRLDPEHGLDSDHRLRAGHGPGSDHRLDPDHRLDSDHKPGSRRGGGQAQSPIPSSEPSPLFASSNGCPFLHKATANFSVHTSDHTCAPKKLAARPRPNAATVLPPTGPYHPKNTKFLFLALV